MFRSLLGRYDHLHCAKAESINRHYKRNCQQTNIIHIWWWHDKYQSNHDCFVLSMNDMNAVVTLCALSSKSNYCFYLPELQKVSIPFFIFMNLSNCWSAVPFHRAWIGVNPGQVISPSKGLAVTPTGNLEFPINLMCMSLFCGRKSECPERTHTDLGRTCKFQRFKPRTFLMLGNNANHCTTTPPQTGFHGWEK